MWKVIEMDPRVESKVTRVRIQVRIWFRTRFRVLFRIRIRIRVGMSPRVEVEGLLIREQFGS